MRSIEDSDYEEPEEVEEEGEEFNEDGEPVPAAKETPQQKITREKAELKEEAATGKLEAQGFYFFYHVFKFIAILAILLAVICGFALAYLLMKVFRKTGERVPFIPNNTNSSGL